MCKDLVFFLLYCFKNSQAAVLLSMWWHEYDMTQPLNNNNSKKGQQVQNVAPADFGGRKANSVKDYRLGTVEVKTGNVQA